MEMASQRHLDLEIDGPKVLCLEPRNGLGLLGAAHDMLCVPLDSTSTRSRFRRDEEPSSHVVILVNPCGDCREPRG